MIMPSDKEYIATKLIMQGKSSIKDEFKQLGDWIDKTYDVKTINIIYDTIKPDNSPRLQICFEFSSEKEKFSGPTIFSFDVDRQHAISAQFKKIMIEKGLVRKGIFSNPFKKNTYKVDDIFVYYSAFEPIARQEANEGISRKRIEKLKNDIGSNDLWEISNVFSGVTFFLYTDEQVKLYENSSVKENWSKQYFEILKEYDEFDYFKEADFLIALDSKENFDKNYQSNWYYYYK